MVDSRDWSSDKDDSPSPNVIKMMDISTIETKSVAV